MVIIPVAGVVLDGCVLSVISHKDTYGYELTQKLRQSLDINETALYPVLRKLQKEDCLETYNIAHGGRNRKYYKITDLGKERLEASRAGWMQYKKNAEDLLFFKGEENE